MPRCTRCTKLRRVRRTLWQRFWYQALYECTACHRRTGDRRKFTFRFSREVRCPRCGARDLRHLNHRDKIEAMSRHPLSLLQGLFGAPLFLCPLCRLQFYDFRRREKDTPNAALGQAVQS